MSTAAPAVAPAPVLKPGVTSSEFSLANLAAIGGIGLVGLSVVLGVFHPLPDMQPLLLKGGLALLAGSPAVYGVFRTALKYGHMARGFEAQANMVAALIPGTAGADTQKVLAKLEEVLNALPDDPGDAPATPPAPTAVAAAAGSDVAKDPAKTL